MNSVRTTGDDLGQFQLPQRPCGIDPPGGGLQPDAGRGAGRRHRQLPLQVGVGQAAAERGVQGAARHCQGGVEIFDRYGAVGHGVDRQFQARVEKFQPVEPDGGVRRAGRPIPGRGRGGCIP